MSTVGTSIDVALQNVAQRPSGHRSAFVESDKQPSTGPIAGSRGTTSRRQSERADARSRVRRRRHSSCTEDEAFKILAVENLAGFG
jgi:hypothetical protein